MRIARLFSVLVTFAAVVGLQAATAPIAQAAFLGDRGMVFVSGKTSPTGETDILAFTYRNGTATLVLNYTSRNHAVNLSPTVSAEGGPHIIFVQKDNANAPGDIYVMDRYPPGGGLPNLTPLTRDGDDEEQPAGSPSGGKIAYVRWMGNTPQIWTMSLSGRNQEAFTCCNTKGSRGRGSVIQGTQPAWSPNSEWIAYVTDGGSPQIAVASVTGKPPLDSTVASFQVTTGGGTSPNWSPLGDRIAYVTPSGQLAVVHFDPSGAPQAPMVFDTPPAGQRDANPAWSPDAFTTYNGHNNGLILFDRGSTLWSVDPNAARPAAQRLRLKGFVAGANPDWQPLCMNKKPTGNRGAVIRGTNGPDLLCGGKGNDTIYGNGGDDRIFAGDGSDKVYGGDGNDFILGGQGGGSNYIDGGPGNDHIEGGLGNDTIVDAGPNSGNDVIEAQDGTDTIRAGDGIQGNDRVDGGYGTNTCYVDNLEGGGPPALDFIWNCSSVVLDSQAVAPGP
jgi:Tol biopolymer transport system component